MPFLQRVVSFLLVVRTTTWSIGSKLPRTSKFIDYISNTNRRFCTSGMAYKAVQRGIENDESFRVYLEGESGPISAWHDVPLYADKKNNIFNMIVEIPRWSNAKMEMNTKAKLNYIKQDEKKGKLRYVANVFPFHGYMWNYGALPQTWEDPEHTDEHTNCKGDNDPLDVCEIGDKVHKRGAIIQVKVLGVMAMIDEGETDWKVLVIDVNDPMADQINDVEDIEKYKPGLIKSTYDWFVLYKIPDGKPKNTFAFNGEAKNKAFAMTVICQTSEQWQKLMRRSDAPLCNASVTLHDAVSPMSQQEAVQEFNTSSPPGPSKPFPTSLDTQYFVS